VRSGRAAPIVRSILGLTIAGVATGIALTAMPVAAQPGPDAAPRFLPVALRAVGARDLPVAATLRPATASPTVPAPTPTPPAPTPMATSVPTETPPSGPDVTTTHYDLHVEGTDVADVARMLEALHGDLSAFFGQAPGGRLRGGVYATLDAMKAALAADGETYHGGGGYYSPATRAFYLFVQPSEYFTRQLILHEATHQFHFLCAGGDHSPSGGWYVEGLAEHFGMHNWDDAHLATGVVPAISLEDYPARALASFDAHGGDLADLIAGGQGWDRPDGWALVSFLVDTRVPLFRDLFARLDRGDDPPGSWAAVFGPVTPAIAAEYRAWLAGHQQPWREVWRAWQERGDVLEGKSDVVTLAVLKSTPARLTAEVIPIAGPIAAGLVFGFRSADDFILLQLRANRDVWVLHRIDGGWQFVGGGHAEPTAERDVLAVEVDGDTVTTRVNGVAIDARAAPGQVGLSVEGGSVHFRVSVEP
jgi:hypothetical protein